MGVGVSMRVRVVMTFVVSATVLVFVFMRMLMAMIMLVTMGVFVVMGANRPPDLLRAIRIRSLYTSINLQRSQFHFPPGAEFSA